MQLINFLKILSATQGHNIMSTKIKPCPTSQSVIPLQTPHRQSIGLLTGNNKKMGFLDLKKLDRKVFPQN